MPGWHVIVVDHRCVADVGTVFDNDPSTDDATTNDDLAADHPSSDDNPGTAINDAAADGRQRVLRELCPGQSGRGRTALPGTTRLPT